MEQIFKKRGNELRNLWKERELLKKKKEEKDRGRYTV